MNTLKLGSTGNQVIQLQLLLNGHLSPEIRLKNDGHFGVKTEAAVNIFQKQKGLDTDGIVGSITWQALSGKQSPTVKTVSDQVTVWAPWYDIAEAEIGVVEIMEEDKHNKRILEYHSTTTLGAKTDEIAWCSSFVNWVMQQSGIEGTNNALAKSWASWGFPVDRPRNGDIVVIKRKNKQSDASTGSSTGYHVGFYVTANTVVISILGGNQSDQVKQSNFMLRSYEIITYRRPIKQIVDIPLPIHSMLRYYV